MQSVFRFRVKTSDKYLLTFLLFNRTLLQERMSFVLMVQTDKPNYFVTIYSCNGFIVFPYHVRLACSSTNVFVVIVTKKKLIHLNIPVRFVCVFWQFIITTPKNQYVFKKEFKNCFCFLKLKRTVNITTYIMLSVALSIY